MLSNVYYSVFFLFLFLNIDGLQIHDQMTNEELMHYFGTTDFEKIKDMYEVGTLRKVNNNQILTRMLEFGKSNGEDYVFEAMGSEINLKMQKNNLLGKND